MYNSDAFDREIKAQQKRSYKKNKPMTANEWRCCDGGTEPISCSLDNIFAAYRDYRKSQQWN